MNSEEIEALFRQSPETRAGGGFQSLLVGLQDSLDRKTGEIHLTNQQKRRIKIYAFAYGNGGWEKRLTTAFKRHLGPALDQG